MTPNEKLSEIMDIAELCGGVDGSHHKQWGLDQIIRIITGPEGYGRWLEGYKHGEYGPETYEWDEGIAP